jgi:twitching motility protein PilU
MEGLIKIQEMLQVMVDIDASDLYLTVARPPMYRINGLIHPRGEEPFAQADLDVLAKSVMNDWQNKEFEAQHEMNMAMALPGISRFRVNIFRQRGSVGLVIRRITTEVPTLEDLGLPPILGEIAMTKRGLVLVVGATGSGKSTSQAAMVDYRNKREQGHIITIEDPIEFVHSHKKSIITQREVGFDTHSFGAALKNTLRQAPDVILVGEIRDTETMEAAITFAETGHLCLGTLHSNNANQAIERVMNFFPHERHGQIYLQLSLNLRAIVSQRLVRTIDGKRTAALEIMMDTPYIKDLIKRGEVDTIKDGMEQGVQEGCQTFDQALFGLYKEGKISLEHALINADSTNNLRLKIKLAGLKYDQEPDVSEETAHLHKHAVQAAAKPASAFRIKRT